MPRSSVRCLKGEKEKAPCGTPPIRAMQVACHAWRPIATTVGGVSLSTNGRSQIGRARIERNFTNRWSAAFPALVASAIV